MYAAEFIHRKNHRFIIDALPQLVREIPHLKIIFAGTGELLESTKDYARKKRLDRYIDFPGFREDVSVLMQLSDMGISSSRQEGYGMHIAEGMLCGLPFVVTEDRGHREMMINGVNGFMYSQNDQQKFIEYILYLYKNPAIREKMAQDAPGSVQKCSSENALNNMIGIYEHFLQ